jgi:hypothetical protein
VQLLCFCSFGQAANFDTWSRALNWYLQRLTPTAAVLLTAVLLAGCQTVTSSPRTPLYEPVRPLYEPVRQSKMVIHAKALKAAREARAAKAARAARAAKAARAARAAKAARAARAKATQAAAPVRPAETNGPALGVELLGEELRLALFQQRLRGLCEIEKVYQLSSRLWRATCTKGGAFNIKVYPDGYMSLTRS